MHYFTEIAVRSSLILLVVLAILAVLRRSSAADRYLVLLGGLCLVILVPIGVVLFPKVSWNILPPGEVISYQAFSGAMESFPTGSTAWNRPSLFDYAVVVLILGMVAQIAFIGGGLWSVLVIRRSARPVKLPGEVAAQLQQFLGSTPRLPVLVSDDISVPILAGWWKSVVILPAESRAWSREELSMVVHHEHAHFCRGDSRWLPLICAVRVLYWWNPLARMVLARLFEERENACDDLVLSARFPATDYADLLVQTARRVQHPLRWDNALAMASQSALGSRIESILNPMIDRRPTSSARFLAILFSSLVLGWFFMAIDLGSQVPSPKIVAQHSGLIWKKEAVAYYIVSPLRNDRGSTPFAWALPEVAPEFDSRSSLAQAQVAEAFLDYIRGESLKKTDTKEARELITKAHSEFAAIDPEFRSAFIEEMITRSDLEMQFV